MKYFNFVLVTLIMLLVVLSLRLHMDNIETRKENPITTDYATRPDTYLESANRDIKRHYFKTSQRGIDKAITAMRLIEGEVDEKSVEAINYAIEELLLIKAEIAQDVVDHEHLKEGFTYALNALAYTQMRASEDFCNRGENVMARDALIYAMDHLHNAMRFSDFEETQLELTAFNTIDSLINNDLIHKQALQASLRPLIYVMDSIILQR